MEPGSWIIYISLAIILYYFMQDLFTPKNGVSLWLAWGFALILFLFIGWLLWQSWKQKKVQKPTQRQIQEELYVQDNKNKEIYDESLFDKLKIPDQHKNVNEADTSMTEDDSFEEFKFVDHPIRTNKNIDWDYFKNWYLSPEFLNKYTLAIKEGYQIKLNKLIDLRKKYIQDYQIIQTKSKESPILANKNDDAKMIESVIETVTKLILEVEEALKKISIEDTRKRLMSAVHDPKNGLNSVVGRKEVKDFLALQLYTFAQNPRVFFSNFQNLAIYGSSGMGKTKIAQVIGHVYASSGICVRNHVHIITKASLTTAFVNETPKITRNLLLSNLESVVFLDEAYSLTRPKTRFGDSIDHGTEAIEEIVNFLDKMKGFSIFIAAGYKKDMKERFMTVNEGMPRRFPHILKLSPYNSTELTQILLNFLKDTCPEINFKPKNQKYMEKLICFIKKHHEKAFEKQAGSIENLSGDICRSIYGSPEQTWTKNWKQIIKEGFNSYLSNKGCGIVS